MPQQSTPENEPYLGDLYKTQVLAELFNVLTAKPDEKWQQTFFENVADASFMCGDPQVIQGPDGFPYFELNIPRPNTEFQCFVLRHLKDDFLLQNGFGVVIHPAKSPPDWVFTYGDIVNFHLRNEFYTNIPEGTLPSEEIITEEEQVLIGQPSQALLPQHTRNVLRVFLKYHGIQDAKLLLMQRQFAGSPQELVFNMTPDKFPSQQQYENVMRSIGWFLPRHYSYVAMEESTFPGSFEEL